MFNYFKFAWRHLRSNPMYFLINIAGLSVGMTVARLIGLWIPDECSYDRANPNYDRIAQVMQHEYLDGIVYPASATPIPLVNEGRTVYGYAFKRVAISYR